MTQSDSAILSRVHFFWVDERCVPADDDQSNYRLADLHLFKPLNISRANIHRICGELEPADAAKKAIAELQAIAPQNDQRAPILDWAFLGMGEDGHIGSLFPELSSKALDSMPLYAPVTASKPPPNRIALNLATLIRARHAWVFITGPGKDKALAESLSPHGSTPLGRLLARRDKTLIWRAN
jgi:6-phosphogluconolactonase